jgi:mRNA interferase HigB
MRIISLRTLREFWEEHPEAQHAIAAWYHEVKRAIWKTSADVKETYRTADILSNGRVVFNIRRNDYRIIVAIHYKSEIVFIRFVGTHEEYDKVDAETI